MEIKKCYDENLVASFGEMDLMNRDMRTLAEILDPQELANVRYITAINREVKLRKNEPHWAYRVTDIVEDGGESITLNTQTYLPSEVESFRRKEVDISGKELSSFVIYKSKV